MTQIVLVGIGAGIASALLYLSPLSGTMLAFPLFAICGLPIAIAGIAWNSLAAGIAAIAASMTILIFFPAIGAVFYLLLFGAPIAWLSRLATLSRPADPTDSDVREWYPLGRLLVHAAAAVAAGLIIVGMIVGFDPESLRAEFTDALAAWVAQSPGGAPPSTVELESFAGLLVSILTYTTSAWMLIIIVFNIWLAARVADISGRLQRPRKAVWRAVLPQWAALVFIVAVVLAFMPGVIGEAAGAVAGAFGAALLLIGLAVLHVVTLGANLRVLILVTTYVVLIMFGFPVLILAILGLAETFLQIRERRLGAVPPST